LRAGPSAPSPWTRSSRTSRSWSPAPPRIRRSVRCRSTWRARRMRSEVTSMRPGGWARSGWRWLARCWAESRPVRRCVVATGDAGRRSCGRLGCAARGYDQLMSYGDVAHASTQAVNRAVSSYLLGRFDDARRYADACREMSASDDAINQYSWRSVEAKLLAREGRTEDAIRLIQEAIGLA